MTIQGKPDLTYQVNETKVVALLIARIKEVHVQQFNLQRGLKEFGEAGVMACREELKQIHNSVLL